VAVAAPTFALDPLFVRASVPATGESLR
jgi:hypothetical protein